MVWALPVATASGAVTLTSVSVERHQISAAYTKDPTDIAASLEASQSLTSPDDFSQAIFPDDGFETIEAPVPGGHYFVRVIYQECETCDFVSSSVLELDVESDAATVTSVSLAGNVLSAAWTLPPAAAALRLEVSTSPALGPFGFASALEFDVDPNQTSFSGPLPGPLPPLPYYVLVVTTPRPDLCFSVINGCALELSNIATVGSPPPGSGAPPGGSGGPGAAGSATDKVVSLGAVTARTSQDVDKLSITLDPGEGVKAKLSGSVTVPGASRTYRFKTVNKSVSAGKKTKLSLKLAKKAKRAVKKALRRKKRLKAKLTLVVTDNAGNAQTKKYTVRLKP